MTKVTKARNKFHFAIHGGTASEELRYAKK